MYGTQQVFSKNKFFSIRVGSNENFFKMGTRAIAQRKVQARHLIWSLDTVSSALNAESGVILSTDKCDLKKKNNKKTHKAKNKQTYMKELKREKGQQLRHLPCILLTRYDSGHQAVLVSLGISTTTENKQQHTLRFALNHKFS